MILKRGSKHQLMVQPCRARRPIGLWVAERRPVYPEAQADAHQRCAEGDQGLGNYELRMVSPEFRAQGPCAGYRFDALTGTPAYSTIRSWGSRDQRR